MHLFRLQISEKNEVADIAKSSYTWVERKGHSDLWVKDCQQLSVNIRKEQTRNRKHNGIQIRLYESMKASQLIYPVT